MPDPNETHNPGLDLEALAHNFPRADGLNGVRYMMSRLESLSNHAQEQRALAAVKEEIKQLGRVKKPDTEPTVLSSGDLKLIMLALDWGYLKFKDDESGLTREFAACYRILKHTLAGLNVMPNSKERLQKLYSEMGWE